MKGWPGRPAESDTAVTESGEARQQKTNHALRRRALILMRPDLVLRWHRKRFRVERDGELVASVPPKTVDRILLFGHVEVTTPCIHHCLSQAIPIVLANGRGRCRGVIAPLHLGRLQRASAQFSVAQDENACLEIARELIGAKVNNSRVLMTRYARSHSLAPMRSTAAHLRATERNIQSAESLESLLGMEGDAARRVFNAWAEAFDPGWGFSGRRKRPATDPINSLLSFGYWMLYHHAVCHAIGEGLDVRVGFLHQPRTGHAALASDLVEPLRAPVVDAVVLNAALNHRLSPQDFDYPQGPHGPCRLSRKASRWFVRALDRKLGASAAAANETEPDNYQKTLDTMVRDLSSWLLGGREFKAPRNR